jgi:hypothetical protein
LLRLAERGRYRGINAGTYRFVIACHLMDSGIRDEKFQRDTYSHRWRRPRQLQRRLELRSLRQLRQDEGRHDDLGYVDRQRSCYRWMPP